MTLLLIGVLAVWLGGLTWYVVRLALAPVPVEDVRAALREIAVAHRTVLSSKPGRELLRKRLAERAAKLAEPPA